MKKKIVALTLVCTMLFGVGAECKAKRGRQYPDVGLVTSCRKVKKLHCYKVNIVMQNGNKFSFYSEDGDWSKNNLVAVIMDSKGTPYVIDDTIEDAIYGGWISNREASHWVKEANCNWR